MARPLRLRGGDYNLQSFTQAEYISALHNGLEVDEAARRAGVTRMAVCAWRKSFPAFAKQEALARKK